MCRVPPARSVRPGTCPVKSSFTMGDHGLLLKKWGPARDDIALLPLEVVLHVNGHGYFAAYNGKKWSPSRTLGFNVVSSASALFCVAAGGGRAVVFDGTTWSARESHDHLLDVQSISCPSVRFCMAGGSGAVAIYDGKSWSRLQVADAYQVCSASKSFCVTVSPMGEAGLHLQRPDLVSAVRP